MNDYDGLLTPCLVVLALGMAILWALRADRESAKSHLRLKHSIFLWVDGESQGPFTAQDVLAKLRAGAVNMSTLCRLNDGEWCELETVSLNIKGAAKFEDAPPAIPKPADSVVASEITPGTAMTAVGIILLASGLVLGVYFAFAYEVNAPGSTIINIGLLNNRTLGCASGLAGAVIGAVVFTGGVVMQQMRKGRKE